MAIFRAGGFKSYQLTLITVNLVWKKLFGSGLAFAANTGIARYLAVLVRPVGWTITGIWTVFDIASPAYRITIPGVLYVAMLRQGMTAKAVEEIESDTDESA